MVTSTSHFAFVVPNALSFTSLRGQYRSSFCLEQSPNFQRSTLITTPRCSMRPYLEMLIERKHLTTEQAQNAVDYAVGGDAHDAEIAGLLCLLAAKGETSSEITGVVNALKSRMIGVNYNKNPILDIVGTGGDGANTVNISTAASLVAAACGCYVGKHGNRSVSSKSGSADVLQELGIELSLSSKGVEQCIEKSGIGFMFAPNHHPCLKRVGPIRKAMKIRTVFNIVGPFLNPCAAKHVVIGVYKPELLDIAADVLINSGIEKGVVVHTEGLDEFSNTGIANMIEISQNGKIQSFFDPQKELGMKKVQVQDLRGGDAKFNADVIREVLAGTRDDAISDAIALNAAAGCWIYGLDASIGEGLERARSVLKTGAALKTLQKWSDASNEAD